MEQERIELPRHEARGVTARLPSIGVHSVDARMSFVVDDDLRLSAHSAHTSPTAYANGDAHDEQWLVTNFRTPKSSEAAWVFPQAASTYEDATRVTA